ncbi:(2Fe-2S)-binding protein [Albidovulum sp.]|uniref:(2Fe-2S)-binding protein n=1 Tax=Albidovulum sp. TaxID=1872424 RepID=UPI002C235E61|nr:(2Fe-2S)-binding protein [Albidovulum sp.]
MKTAFRDLAAGGASADASEGARVPVSFEGRALLLRAGANLAAELLVAGVMPFRHTPVSGAPRGPFCMMGACYDCLVRIGGVTQQACMIEVAGGMEIAMPPAGPADGGTDD